MISFSGIDCGGKSTQMEKVFEEFKKRNIKCKMIHSRGGYTPMLEFVKNILRTDKGSSRAEQDLYRENVHKNPKKRKLLLWLSIFDLGLYYGIYFRLVELFGTIILADRYFWDSYIDFKLKYGEFDFEKWIVWKFAKAIYKKPKCSIIYTIPAELSVYRSTLKDEPWPEPIEMRRIRIDEYMKEIKNNRWKNVIDAQKSIDEVFEVTMECIKNENILHD